MRVPDNHRIANRARRVATICDDDLPAMIQRAYDWTQPPRQGEGHQWTRGGGPPQDTPGDDGDRLEDHRAGRYHSELTDLTNRLYADLGRIEELRRVLLPSSPQRLGTADMQTAQLAADGWCISCARDRDRDDRPWLEPVAAGVYSDTCKWCGRWRSDNRRLPPIELVRYRHSTGGKRLTTKVVDAILRRSA